MKNKIWKLPEICRQTGNLWYGIKRNGWYSDTYRINGTSHQIEVRIMRQTLIEERKNKVSYANFIIRTFAYGFKRPVEEVVRYLDEYGGLQFLFDNYEYEHTQSEYHTHMALLEVCRNNGGWL